MADTPRRPSGPTSRPSGSSPSTSGSHDRQALLKAYQDVVKQEQDRRGAPPPPPPPPPSKAPFWAFMLSMAGALTAVLVLQPNWLFPKAPPETPAVKEASLRLRMFGEIERVEAYKTVNGTYPHSLLDALGDTSGVQYSAGAEGFSLTGRNGPLSLTYTSSQSAREFLGNSYALISGRRQQ